METEGFTDRPTTRQELAMDVKHAWNYIVSRFTNSDHGMSAYREKVPKAVGKQYKTILDKAKPNTALTAA